MKPAMTTVADPPPSDSVAGEPTGAPAPCLNKLKVRTPLWPRLSKATGGWTVLLGVLFVFLSYRPLYHTDLWGHLAYGRWISEYGALPLTEPLLPLCEGVPTVDTAWLSQVIGFGMYQRFGVTAMQFLYAVPITVAFGLLLWGVLRRTRGSILAGLIVVSVFGWVDYQQLLIVRPQLVGLMLFAALFVLMNACRWRRAFWIVVSVMFALWANLHGSWIVGLGLLGTLCLGRAIDVARHRRIISAVFVDRRVRRLCILTGVAAFAVVLNPYGYRLYAEVFAISGNPNVRDLIEWKPLTLGMSQGRAAAAITLALIFTYRLSPRRVTAAEVLLLVGLGGAAMWSSRMIHWWAPLAAYYLALHVAAVWRSWHRTRRVVPASNGFMSVVTAGLILMSFVYTPFGLTLLHGQPAKPSEQASLLRRSTSSMTPISAVRYLHDEPVEGFIFNSYEWGDYLLFAGPADIQLFTNSHAHLIPREVWKDSIAIEHAANGWEDRLDGYGVTAVVLNSRTDATLAHALKDQPETWQLAFEDRTAVIFRRRERN